MAAKHRLRLDEKQAILIAKALADPRRYDILKRLKQHEKDAAPCAALRECMEISAPTFSHHMRELELAGLVRPVREGKFVSYLLQHDVIDAYFEHLRADLS